MTTTKWTEKCPVPSNIKVINHLASIGDEFLIAPSLLSSLPKQQAIYKYNPTKNEFDVFIKFSPNRFFSGNCLCHDIKNNKLYIFHTGTKYTTIDIHTKNISSHNIPLNQYEKISRGGRCISTEHGESHFIGLIQTSVTGQRDLSCKHISCNNQKITVNPFIKDTLLYAPGFVYLKSKQVLIAFGGLDRNRMTTICKMFEYSFRTQKWIIMKCKLPCPMTLFTPVVTFGDQYIIAVTTEQSTKTFLKQENIMVNTFHVFDVQKSKWYKSAIKLLVKSNVRTVIIGNVRQDKIIVGGYIRNECKMFYNIAQDVICLIAKWFRQDFLHVIETGGKHKHWCISVDSILNN